MPSSTLDVRTSTGSGRGGNCGTPSWACSGCWPPSSSSSSSFCSRWSWFLATTSCCCRRCWWYWRWSEWAAMCWSETAKTAKAILGRLRALQVAAAAAAVDGIDSAAAANLSALWLLLLDDAWLEHRCPIPSSSSLGITAPESWLDFLAFIDLIVISPIACSALSESVRPDTDVLAAAAAATAAVAAAVAAADVSLGRRAAYSIVINRSEAAEKRIQLVNGPTGSLNEWRKKECFAKDIGRVEGRD